MSAGGPSFAELIDHGDALAELPGALDLGQRGVEYIATASLPRCASIGRCLRAPLACS